MATALAGLDREEQTALLARLATVKENLRGQIQRKQPIPEQRYG